MTERPTLDELAVLIQGKRAKDFTPKGFVLSDRGALITALYILGASQPQLAQLFDVKRETIKSTITRKITPLMRQQVRPRPIHKPLLSQEQVGLYRDTYYNYRLELSGLDAVTMAARIRQITPPLND